MLASVLLIANTIRLSLYARRREVEVMKLVGATDWFIRWPFVIEGIIVGAAGALLAIVVLGVGQGRPARPARRQLDADRGAADDHLHGARGRAPRGRGARVGARVRALAAALPQGLTGDSEPVCRADDGGAVWRPASAGISPARDPGISPLTGCNRSPVRSRRRC